VCGKRGITPETAWLFSEAFATSPEFWLNLQSIHELSATPYQYYAVEAIVNQVLYTEKFGCIWHITGSGKTLTSFKTAQILTQSPHVHKVVFVVDRKDLDFQTIKEFNSFSEGSVDATNDTKKLVAQFGDTHNRIKDFFTNVQMFGFTGAPIFAKNALGKRTTKDLFGECLHKYVITDAIRDENVLKFAIEYIRTVKQKRVLLILRSKRLIRLR
tara:strand:- start:1151 stop:1792 length:642 start_codon:yes stop_codon:yes gene_type:complete